MVFLPLKLSVYLKRLQKCLTQLLMHGSGSEFLGKMEKRYKEFSMKKSEAESLRLRVKVSISDAKGSGLPSGACTIKLFTDVIYGFL